jgi:hypothetical protein
MIKSMVAASLAVVFAGCASYIETVKIDPKTLKVAGPGVEGIVYYEPMLVKLRYEFTQMLDKDRGLVGSSDEGTCRRVVQKEEVITLPDYQNARAILHKPSWFSAAEFGATLNNGMLVSVTSKSTPQTAPILEQLVAAKTAGILVAPLMPGCNAGPVITSRERVTF